MSFRNQKTPRITTHTTATAITYTYKGFLSGIEKVYHVRTKKSLLNKGIIEKTIAGCLEGIEPSIPLPQSGVLPLNYRHHNLNFQFSIYNYQSSINITIFKHLIIKLFENLLKIGHWKLNILNLCRGGESNTRRLPLQGSAPPLSYRGICF